MAIVFTFGSNLEGRHGKGSALEARQKWGAIYGQGEGRQGNSYGIPTKATPYITLSLHEIEGHIQKFIQKILLMLYGLGARMQVTKTIKLRLCLKQHHQMLIFPMNGFRIHPNQKD